MSYTALLLQRDSSDCLSEVAQSIEDKLKVADMLKQVAREAFNGTMPVICVKNNEQLKQAIKIAITAKYISAKEVETVADLSQQAAGAYFSKLHDKIIRASKNIGTHVHKMSSTCIEDGANCFKRPAALKSGVTSGSVESGRHVTGSKDGTLVAAFGILSATYKVGNEPALSLFERIAASDETVIELFTADFGLDEEFIEQLVESCSKHLSAAPAAKVSQFHKQNFLNWGDARITVTPLQSVNTTVALAQAINKTFESKGRVNVKRYAAGGAQTQNVSSLNQDMGGSIPHLKAWIPGQRKKRDAFYFAYRTNRLSLSKPQKELVATLAWNIGRVEEKGSSNFSDRKAIGNHFKQQARLLVSELEDFASAINQLTDEEKLNEVKAKTNKVILDYFTADSKQAKSEASETLAYELVALVAAEMKRNKLNIHIEDNAVDAAIQVLEKGEVSCRSL